MKTTTTKKEPKFPETASEAINMAIKDLKAVERSKKYIVDMSIYHSPDEKKGQDICYVCLAGAVMANTLKVPIKDFMTPSGLYNYGIEGKWSHLCRALDDARCNYLEGASMECDLFKLGCKEVRDQLNEEFPSTPQYSHDPVMFIKFLQRMAKLYKKQGN